jgi:hypothetical protein
MKESIMNRALESSSGRGKDFTSRYTRCTVIEMRRRHLCVVCALRKHDFEERAPDPEPDGCEAAPLAKAWIDGLPYTSVYHTASRGINCTDCGERVLMTYDRELTLEQPLTLYAR